MRNTNKLIHKEHCAESGTLSDLKKWELLLLFLLRRKLPKQGQGQDAPQSPGMGGLAQTGPLLLVLHGLASLCPEASPVLSESWLLAGRAPSPQTHFQPLLRAETKLAPLRGCCLCLTPTFPESPSSLTLAANIPTGAKQKLALSGSQEMISLDDSSMEVQAGGWGCPSPSE